VEALVLPAITSSYETACAGPWPYGDEPSASLRTSAGATVTIEPVDAECVRALAAAAVGDDAEADGDDAEGSAMLISARASALTASGPRAYLADLIDTIFSNMPGHRVNFAFSAATTASSAVGGGRVTGAARARSSSTVGHLPTPMRVAAWMARFSGGTTMPGGGGGRSSRSNAAGPWDCDLDWRALGRCLAKGASAGRTSGTGGRYGAGFDMEARENRDVSQELLKSLFLQLRERARPLAGQRGSKEGEDGLELDRDRPSAPAVKPPPRWLTPEAQHSSDLSCVPSLRSCSAAVLQCSSGSSVFATPRVRIGSPLLRIVAYVKLVIPMQ
jgi:hypothetical protein